MKYGKDWGRKPALQNVLCTLTFKLFSSTYLCHNNMNYAQKFTTLRCFMPKTAEFKQSKAGGSLMDGGVRASPDFGIVINKKNRQKILFLPLVPSDFWYFQRLCTPKGWMISIYFLGTPILRLTLILP